MPNNKALSAKWTHTFFLHCKNFVQNFIPAFLELVEFTHEILYFLYSGYTLVLLDKILKICKGDEMDTKENKLVSDTQLQVTPSTISNIDPNDFSAAELASSIISVRITMIQNLSAMSDDLYATITATDDLGTKLALYKELQKMYSEINSLSSKLEKKSNMTTLSMKQQDAPYLDYESRKSRSRTWQDYLMFCKINELTPVKKRELFDKLTELGFRLSSTMGEIMLVPPGVRMQKGAKGITTPYLK